MDKSRIAAPTIIFMAYTGQHMVYPFLPLYILEKGGSPLDVGLAFLANLILAALLSVPMGRLSDRYGRKKVIALGCILGLTGYALIPLLNTPLLIIAAFALAGVGHSAYGPATQALVGDVAKRGRVATMFGVVQTVRGLTGSLGPAIGGFVGLLGLRYVFALSAFFFLLAIPTTALLLKGVSREVVKERTDEKVVNRLTSVITNPRVIFTVFLTFTFGYSMMSIRSFVPLYISELGGDTAVIGLVFTAQAIVAMLARIPIARYSDVSGKRETLVVLGYVIAASMVILIPILTSIEQLTVALMVFAFFASFGSVIPWVIIAEQTSFATRGAVMGINNSMLYAGQGTGSALTGLVIQNLGFGAGFSSTAAILIAMGVAYVMFAYARRSK